MKCKIVDLVFDINGKLSGVLSDALAPYVCCDDEKVDVTVNISINNNIKIFAEPTHVVSKRHWVVTDNKCVTYDTEATTGKCVMQTIADKPWNNLDIEICDLNKEFGIQDSYYMFNVLGEIFRIIVLMHNGIVLHSSAISYKNNGILFSAPSGTGKSTHTGLWKEMFGDDVIYINDDTPALRITDEGVFMYGTPWAGTTGINTNMRVPLKGIVALKRGDENSIKKANSIEAINLLVNETRKPLIDDMIELSLERIENLIENIPVYVLHCTISEDAVTIVKNEIGL